MEFLIIAAAFFIGLQAPTFLAKPIKYIKDLYEIRRVKPFDCEPCFGMWFAVIISLFTTNLLSTILIGVIVFNLIKNYLIVRNEF